MKYIKKFENKEEPKIGDYVLMYSTSSDDKIAHFIKNNFGKIVNFDYDKNKKVGVAVLYDNIPEFLKKLGMERTRTFGIEQIVAFAESEDELKLKISANKYNL